MGQDEIFTTTHCLAAALLSRLVRGSLGVLRDEGRMGERKRSKMFTQTEAVSLVNR